MRVAVFSNNGYTIDQSILSANNVYIYECIDGVANYIGQRFLNKGTNDSFAMKKNRLHRIESIIEDCHLILCNKTDDYSKGHMQTNGFELIEYSGHIKDMLYTKEMEAV